MLFAFVDVWWKRISSEETSNCFAFFKYSKNTSVISSFLQSNYSSRIRLQLKLRFDTQSTSDLIKEKWNLIQHNQLLSARRQIHRRISLNWTSWSPVVLSGLVRLPSQIFIHIDISLSHRMLIVSIEYSSKISICRHWWLNKQWNISSLAVFLWEGRKTNTAG